MEGTRGAFVGSLLALPQGGVRWFGELQMDRRDQELLDKQMAHVALTPRNDGAVMLALTAVFFAGMTIGGFLYAYTGAPIRAIAEHVPPNQQIASNEVPIFIPQGAIRR
jgi:hypothetical protein